MSTVFAPGKTPGTTSSTHRRQHLPPKLVQDGANRLAFLAPASVAIIVAVEVSQTYLQPVMASVLADPINRLLTIATVFLGLGIFALHRYHVVSGTTLL